LKHSLTLILFLLAVMLLNGCATGAAGSGRMETQTSGPGVIAQDYELAESSPADIPSTGSPEAITPEKSSVFRGQTSGDNAPLRPVSPAVVALLKQADQAQLHGDLARAAASLERGLRIAPHDAGLWHRLAKVRLAQERFQQAESMAKKSNSLARGDRRLLFANWMAIATSREQRGDLAGKAKAQQEALKYQ